MGEVGKMSNNLNPMKNEEDEVDVPLPGFRFHPTDEELVGFYLRRKVEKKPISIELIKQVDIYKYDPWDLPKASNVGDKEWYFFCKRGRKYRNSIRPNRVTASGFWKATGIDRPIYSSGCGSGGAGGRECIGLKKSLVYYRGSAGKGTKTDWMMHEFRLPTDHDKKSTKHIDVKSIAQEAEVWTLCRILKRGASYRKCLPDWREFSSAAAAAHNNNANNKRKLTADASSKTCSIKSTPYTASNYEAGYIDFRTPPMQVIPQNHDPQRKHFPMTSYGGCTVLVGGGGDKNTNQISSLTTRQIHHDVPTSATSASYPNSCFGPEMNDLIKYSDWDELRSLLEFAYDQPPFV